MVVPFLISLFKMFCTAMLVERKSSCPPMDSTSCIMMSKMGFFFEPGTLRLLLSHFSTLAKSGMLDPLTAQVPYWHLCVFNTSGARLSASSFFLYHKKKCMYVLLHKQLYFTSVNADALNQVIPLTLNMLINKAIAIEQLLLFCSFCTKQRCKHSFSRSATSFTHFILHTTFHMLHFFSTLSFQTSLCLAAHYL